jgi:copper chaperone CopZ
MSIATTATNDIAKVGLRSRVAGMTCSRCERAIETELVAVAGVCTVTADGRRQRGPGASLVAHVCTQLAGLRPGRALYPRSEVSRPMWRQGP